MISLRGLTHQQEQDLSALAASLEMSRQRLLQVVVANIAERTPEAITFLTSAFDRQKESESSKFQEVLKLP